MLPQASCCLPNLALHSSKDLAVSFAKFPEQLIPKDPFTFLLKRHCSHLLGYPRRVLPATIVENSLRNRYRISFLLKTSLFGKNFENFFCLTISKHKNLFQKFLLEISNFIQKAHSVTIPMLTTKCSDFPLRDILRHRAVIVQSA
jgi:hypothetical protein